VPERDPRLADVPAQEGILAVDLRREVEQAAEANKVSMNAEMIARLDRTFAEDTVYGPGSLRSRVYEAGAAFMHAGKARAMSLERAHSVRDGSWVKDRECYQAAMIEAINTFALNFPGGYTPEIHKDVMDRVGRAFDVRELNQLEQARVEPENAQ